MSDGACRERVMALVSALSVAANAASAQNYGTASGLIHAASSNKNITVAPTAPNSTAVYRMQGLAGTITPAVTGNVLIIISGTIQQVTSTTATIGINYQISYGTGTAPTVNTTIAGTQAGVIGSHRNGFTLAGSTMGFTPFSTQAVVTGLVIGTAYWIDLAAESITTASAQGFGPVNIAAIELHQ